MRLNLAQALICRADLLVDLLGGTPCNVVSRFIMEGQDIELYAGVNLPMVIEFY